MQLARLRGDLTIRCHQHRRVEAEAIISRNLFVEGDLNKDIILARSVFRKRNRRSITNVFGLAVARGLGSFVGWVATECELGQKNNLRARMCTGRDPCTKLLQVLARIVVPLHLIEADTQLPRIRLFRRT